MENESRGASRVRPEAVSWVGLGLVCGGILLAAIDMVRFPLMEERLTTPDGGLWWLPAVHQPTEHTVADAFPTTPALVPSGVSEVAWEWEAPQGVSAQGVEPGVVQCLGIGGRSGPDACDGPKTVIDSFGDPGRELSRPG